MTDATGRWHAVMNCSSDLATAINASSQQIVADRSDTKKRHLVEADNKS